MHDVLSGSTALLLAASLSGCAAGTQARHQDSTGRIGNAIVIGVDELEGGGPNLLRLVRHRVSGMQVRSTSGCPEVVMRGHKSISGLSAPSVYVDGIRAANTCILELLDADAVERVEIYPSGVTNRPGYLTNGAGLILVFMRRDA